MPRTPKAPEPKPLPMIDAEVILYGFRFKITKLSQPDLRTLIAALQSLLK